MIDRVLTGGQTGADQAAWRAARTAGVPTGGWIPCGWLTETGPRPEFTDEFGAAEHPGTGDAASDHTARTRRNAEDGDVTLWFGTTDTPGARATLGACGELGRPCLVVVASETRPDDVAAWLADRGARVVNVAGNRESLEPGIGARVERFLGDVFQRMSAEN